MTKRRRKPYENPGRWQVARERGHIADVVPLPPFRDATPLAEGIAAVFANLPAPRAEWVLALERDWSRIAGAAVAAHTRPADVEGKDLLVYVDSSVWLTELEKFSRGALLARVRQVAGEGRIGAIIFRLDPDLPQRRH
jgi:predicted nucleic acid-binding Zn ribbon protein